MSSDTSTPAFPAVAWCNCSHAPSWPKQVQAPLLLHFWDSLCPHSISQLTLLRSLHNEYAHLGLQIFGVHRGPYAFTQNPTYLDQTARRLGLRWPQALDEPGATWPAQPAEDKHGCLLLKPDGSAASVLAPDPGGYTQFMQELGSLWHELDPELELTIAPQSPPQPDLPLTRARAPVRVEHDSHAPQTLELTGRWQVQGHSCLLSERTGTVSVLRPEGPVWAVLSPEAQAPTERPPTARVALDGPEPERAVFGTDVYHSSHGPALRVRAPRLYHILQDPGGAADRLTLLADGPGLRFYAWLFGPCLP